MLKSIYFIGCSVAFLCGLITRIKTRIENSSPFMKNNYKKIGYRRNILGDYIPNEEYHFGVDLFVTIFSIIIFYPLLSRIYFVIIIIGKLIGKRVEKNMPKSRLERFKELNYKIKYTVLSKEEMESALNEMGLNEFDKLQKENDEVDNIEEDKLEFIPEDDEYIPENRYIIKDEDGDGRYEHEVIYIQPTKKKYTLEHRSSGIGWDENYEYKIQGTKVLHKCIEQYEYKRERYYPNGEIGCKMIQNNKVMKGNIIEYINIIKKSWDDNHEGESIIEDCVKEAEKKIESCQKVCKWHEEGNISINCFILSEELSKEEFKNYLISEIDKIKYTKELIKNHLKGSGRELKYLEGLGVRDIVTVDHNKEFTSRDEILGEIEEYCNSHGGDFSTRTVDTTEYEKFLNSEK